MQHIPANQLVPGMFLNGHERITSVTVMADRVNFITLTNTYRNILPECVLMVSNVYLFSPLEGMNNGQIR